MTSSVHVTKTIRELEAWIAASVHPIPPIEERLRIPPPGPEHYRA